MRDMIQLKRHFMAVAAVLAAIVGASAQQKLPVLQQKGIVKPAVANKVGANVASKTAYAWVTRDKGSLPKGLATFDISKPQTMTSLFQLADKAYAGTYGIDKYYFYRYRDDTENQTMQPLAFSSVDLKTGAVTDIADWSSANFICNDMTYDYSSGNIYAMCRAIYTDDILNFDIEYSKLLKIDPKTGTYTTVKDFLTDYSGFTNPTYLTLAADMSGKLYSINIAGQLVTFDKANDYKEKIIGETGFTPGSYLQCMEFDHSSDKLYWAADYKNRVSNFCIVDTETGKATEIGNLGNDSRIAGLYIPFAMPANAAPAGASNLKVTPAAEGALEASLSWTNPTKTFDNKALTAISSVKVMRAGTVVKEFTDATPGQQMTFADNSVPASGLYEYSIIAANADGDGKAAIKEAWVGHDVPAAVTKLGIEVLANGAAKLSWTAPTVGAHKGWLDTGSLKYRITRYPDGTVVADNAEGNEYTDNTVSKLSEYYYTVQAMNGDGEGYEARSASVYAGATAELPYSCAFDTKGQFASWFVIDNNNDGSTWEWKSLTISGNTKGYAMYSYNNKNDGDDYLISPDFNLKKGHKYTLTFGYKAGNSTYKETFDVRMGKGRSAEAQQTVIKDYSTQSGDLASASLQLPEIEEDGTYNISFHATSPKGALKLYITDVKLVDNNPEVGPDPTDPEEKTAPKNLKAKVNDNKSVLLTWNTEDSGTSDNISEGFESYNGFQINPTGTYDWSYIDGDGGIPYYSFEDGFTNPAMKLPSAAIVIDAEQCAGTMVIEDNPPYEGNKYLMFRSNYAAADGSSKAPAADDYFISPRLNFDKSFTFSFWAKSDPDSQEENAEWKWDKEEMRVGYSTTGMEKDDFIWLTQKNEVVRSEWEEHAYTIPASAKYVCIHYCSPTTGYLMCVDNVFIGIQHAEEAAPRKAASTFKGYVVYLDGNKVATTTATSYELTDVADGQHTAKVTALYEDGETEPATVNFTVNPTTAISNAAAGGLRLTYDAATATVSLGTTAEKVEIYGISSAMAERATNTSAVSVANLPAGVYIVKITAGGKTVSRKMVIRK